MSEISFQMLMLTMLLVDRSISLRHLRTCEDLNQKSNKRIDKDKCKQKQELLTQKRNIFIIQPNDRSSRVIELDSNICDEPISSFTWFKIQRRHRPLIYQGNKTVYGNRQLLIEKGTPLSRNNRVCVDKNSGNLRLLYFDPKSTIGTYYFRHMNNDRHPVNYIWYHIDTILNPTDKLVALKIDDIEESSRDMEKRMIKVKRKLNALDQAWPPQKFPSFTILSKFDIHKIRGSGGTTQNCKDKLTIVQVIRRCYVKLDNEKDVKTLTDPKTYLQFMLLRQAFRFLLEKESSETLTNTTDTFKDLTGPFTLTPDKLKFQDPNKNIRDANDRIIEFPCHFTFFKHLKYKSNPFQKSNLFIDIHIKDSCEEVESDDIMGLVNSGDSQSIRDMIVEASPVVSRHVARVFLEGMVRKRLVCSSPLKQTRCENGGFQSILWRKNDVTLFPQSPFEKRVFVTARCEVYFVNIFLNDSGTYSCFVNSNSSSAQSSKEFKTLEESLEKSIEFEVTVKPVSRFSMNLPNLTSVKSHLIILLMWALFIFLMWIYLVIFHIRLVYRKQLNTET